MTIDPRGKRILIVSAIFPPDILGGAEIIALKLAQWLVARGADVAVLATAQTINDVVEDADFDGIRLWRVMMPRRHPILAHAYAPLWAKFIWHIQDHFDPRNRRILGRVLDQFRPDYVNIHVLQGLGYNALKEIAARDLPTLYVLHDLGLVCIRMAMFRNGTECTGQCLGCRASAHYKASLVERIPRLGYIAPSRALLERMKSMFPIAQAPHATILNADIYPAPTHTRTDAPIVRLLYVGRLHASKGVELLLDAADRVAQHHSFQLTIVGGGPDDAHLRKRFAEKAWCRFAGFVTQADISNFMIDSDLLCVPSIWLENSPGVIFHALALGLPVLGSDKGGIPELIEDGVNGRLVPAGDLDSWTHALEDVIVKQGQLGTWRTNAIAAKDRYNQDSNAYAYLEFQERLGNEEKAT
jgi:glycosyltransferase involved in cell wall biosynthesis